MAYLVASLVNLKGEINLRWPHRDRRTDGWYRPYGQGPYSDHWPDAKGAVHAIDIDRDGINPTWIIDHMYHSGAVIHYVIWNRRLWHYGRWGSPQVYTGSNPHTDHMHFSVYHTRTAENYLGSWRIRPGVEGVGPAPPGENQWGDSDPRPEMTMVGSRIHSGGYWTDSYAKGIRDIRKL